MRNAHTAIAIAGLAVAAIAGPALAADALAATTTYTVACDGFGIALAAGDDASVSRDRDGRISLQDTQGGFALASCRLGCLETASSASCRVVAPAPTGPTPPPATPSIDVDCPDGSSWRIERGDDSGVCTTEVDASNNVTGGSCDDGEGNRGEVDCSANGGRGRCVSESGTTTCRKAG